MNKSNLAERVRNFEFVPYVHVYPSTRLFESVESFSLDDVIFSDDVNLYVHIPFCEQKCSFCPYLTIIGSSADFQELYVDAVIKEIEMYRDILISKTVRTVNFGGGTPSLLTPSQFNRIMNILINIKPNLFETAEEVSIEATPESVELDKFRSFKNNGINRVSVGIQTLNDQEIKLSKRHNWENISVNALNTLRNVGIPNVCCDLMYGIEGQTFETWKSSVQGLLEFMPETIELYALAIRPNTSLGIKPKALMSNKEKYDCYVMAREILLAHGYVQDCHLRFIIPNKGFYKQQENVFHGQSLIGFGVGARSYALNRHYRNCFDVKYSKTATQRYINCISNGALAVESQILLDDEEKMRRYVIEHLEHLDTENFEKTFGLSFREKFDLIHEQLLNENLAAYQGYTLVLTPKGLVFRDLIAQQFFSEKTKKAEMNYLVGVGK